MKAGIHGLQSVYYKKKDFEILHFWVGIYPALWFRTSVIWDIVTAEHSFPANSPLYRRGCTDGSIYSEGKRIHILQGGYQWQAQNSVALKHSSS